MTPPPLVYGAETPLAELQTAEQFVVVTLRLWALSHRDPGGRHPDWRAGFAAADIDDAGCDAFDALFKVVTETAFRSLDVRCPRCVHLGDDEGRLLRLLSLLQRGRRSEAAAILSQWVPSAANRMALVAAQGFAVALLDGGLPIPLRHAEAAGAGRTDGAAFADRGLSLVQ